MAAADDREGDDREGHDRLWLRQLLTAGTVAAFLSPAGVISDAIFIGGCVVLAAAQYLGGVSLNQ